MAFGGDNQHIPNGWLLCDGSEVDNTDPLFINLFNVIGYNWGTSNHSNLFNLPDARGVFLRGVTYGGASDPEADLRMPSANGANGGNAVGSLQVDDLKSHTHRMNYSLGAYFGWAGGWGGIGGIHPVHAPSDGGTTDHLPTATGGTETRPKNIYVNYIIKY